MKTVYSRVSEIVGFVGRTEIPSASVMSSLMNKAMSGDIRAFETLFRVRRFSSPPHAVSQVVSMNILEKDWKRVEQVFMEMELADVP